MLTVQAELELEFERGRVEGAGLGPDPGQRKEIAGHDGWVEEWTSLAEDAVRRGSGM